MWLFCSVQCFGIGILANHPCLCIPLSLLENASAKYSQSYQKKSTKTLLLALSVGRRFFWLWSPCLPLWDGYSFDRPSDCLTTVQLVALVAPRFSSSFIAIVPVFDFVGWILRLLLVKSTFSIQLLCTLALQMAKFLEREQLDDARAQLSWLCSRSPSNLSADELAGATLESLAENISDGFVAPLFWYSLLGPLGSLAYRVVNTLDSRVGYRGKFEFLGKTSARCDDVLNLVPARLTCVFLTLAATFVTGCNGSDGIKTAMSDRKQCDSPNAGWPMASMAGLLGVRLEKKGEYCLGAGPPPNHQALKLGFKVSQLTGGIALVVAILYLLIVER